MKAKLGEEYNKRERERVRINYVPAVVLSSAKLTERNRKNKIRNRLSRQRQKEKLRGLVEHESTDDETSGYASNIAESAQVPGPSSSPNRLIVTLSAVKMASNKQTVQFTKKT